MRVIPFLTWMVCVSLCIFDAEAQISRLDNRFKIKRSQPVRRVAPQTTTATRKTVPSSRANAGRQDSSQAESGYITFEGLYNDETIQLPRWFWEEVKDINEQLREKLSPSDYLEILKGERALYGKYARKDAFMRELRGESGSNMTDIPALREKLYKIYENPRDEKIFDSPHFVELPREGILFDEHVSYTNDKVRFADENYILSFGPGVNYGEILSFWDSRTGRIVGKFSFPRAIGGAIVGTIAKRHPIYSMVESANEILGEHWCGSSITYVTYAIDLASRKFQSYGYTHEEIDKKIIAQPRGIFQEVGVHFLPPLFTIQPYSYGESYEEQPPHPWYLTRNECLQYLSLTTRGNGRYKKYTEGKDTTTYADDDVFSIYDEKGNGYELEWGTLAYKNWDEEKGQVITRTREKTAQAIIEKVENKRDYDDWVVSNSQGDYTLFAGGDFGGGTDLMLTMYGISSPEGLYLFPPLQTKSGLREQLTPSGKLMSYRDCLEENKSRRLDLPGGIREELLLESNEMALPVMKVYPGSMGDNIIFSIGLEGYTDWNGMFHLITLNKLNHEYEIINKLPYRKSTLLSPQWMPEHRWFLKPETDLSYSIVHVDDFGDTRKIADFYVDNAQGYAIALPNGRYVGSPGCEKFLQYGDGERVVGMLALAPWRNRPAEVLEALGGNADDIAALRETTKRWLRKQGFDPDNMPQEPALKDFPAVDVHMPNLFSTTDRAHFTVTAKATANDIAKVIVRVDGVEVPQSWSSGLAIAAGEQKELPVEVPLASGQNWIEVTPVDSNGISGDAFRFRTIYKGNYPSDLFIVALGVSDYDDPDLKLQYAAKDAKDIAAAFEKYGTGRKHLLVLTDKEVKDKSVLEKVKIFLSAASLEDRIVFYVAGHGMLDDQLNYYYAPSGFNIDRIGETGIPMDDLLACIQSSKARKRLLLLDTCHSGVLGEEGEEKLAMSGVQLPHGVRAIQHRGMKVRKATGALNTKQKKRYIEDLFSRGDTQRGINIIAGSAGAEYALESGAWKNGVFTASVIQALSGAGTTKDANSDGYFSVAEVLKSVIQSVNKQTGGQQKPSVVAAEAPESMVLVEGVGFVSIKDRIEKSDWKGVEELIGRGMRAYDDAEAFNIMELAIKHNAPVEMLRKLIAHGWSESASYSSAFERALWSDAYKEQKETVAQIFLEKGVKLKGFTRDALNGSPELVEMLLSHGTDANVLVSAPEELNSRIDRVMEDRRVSGAINFTPSYYVSSLYLATFQYCKAIGNSQRSQELEKIRILLENGADPNIYDDYRPDSYISGAKTTPLYFLCRLADISFNDALPVLKLLIQHGADIHFADKNGRQPMDSWNPNYKVLEKLAAAAKAGESLDDMDLTVTNTNSSSYSPAGQTHEDLQPMIDRMRALRCREASSALYQKRLLTLLPMIRNGADVDITLPETKGNTALHYACAIGSWSITQWLVEHGANVNAVTDKGSTPLDCVGEDNAQRIRALLISRGAKKAAEFNQGGAFPQSDAGGGAVPEDAEALNNLGLAYQFGNGKPKNYEEAARCFRRAAEQGHAGAQNNLGFLYHNGWGVPQDYSQAAYWYRLSAQQGNAWGQSNYGTCLEFGWGVKKDLNAAIEMYRRAASQGHASAKKHLKRHGISM